MFWRQMHAPQSTVLVRCVVDRSCGSTKLIITSDFPHVSFLMRAPWSADWCLVSKGPWLLFFTHPAGGTPSLVGAWCPALAWPPRKRKAREWLKHWILKMRCQPQLWLCPQPRCSNPARCGDLLWPHSLQDQLRRKL